MNREIADLYKALDEAIHGLESRVIAAAGNVIKKEKAEIESGLRKIEADLKALKPDYSQGSGGPPRPEPRIPPPPPPRTKSFPSLPTPLTVKALADYVSAQGFIVANYRPDGGLWVCHDDKSFQALAEHIKRGGVQYKYYPNGRKRQPGPQYELDPAKRLS